MYASEGRIRDDHVCIDNRAWIVHRDQLFAMMSHRREHLQLTPNCTMLLHVSEDIGEQRIDRLYVNALGQVKYARIALGVVCQRFAIPRRGELAERS